MKFSKKGLKLYFTNTVWMFLEKLIKLLDGVIVGAYVARYLGPSNFGMLSYAISIALFFSVFCNLGMGQIVTLNLVNDYKNKYIILGSAFFLKIIAFLVGYSLILFYFYNFDNTNEKIIIEIISLFVFFECFNVFNFYFRSKVLSIYPVLSYSISVIISAVIKIYLINIKAEILWFCSAIVLEKALIAIFLIIFFQRENNIFRLKLRIKKAKSIIYECWPLIISGIAITVYMRIDQIMIKEILGVSETGQYSTAILISSAIFAYPMIICNSVFPAIVRAEKNNLKLFDSRMQQLHDFLIWTLIPSSLFVSLVSEPLVLTLFGEKYNEAILVLKIHVWSTIFVAWGLASSSWYILKNMTILALLRNLCGALVNVFLNYFFIYKFGIVGAAYASLMSYFFAYYIFDIFFSKTRIVFLIKCKSLFAPIRYLRGLTFE